jgi:hypothetical protein
MSEKDIYYYTIGESAAVKLSKPVEFSGAAGSAAAHRCNKNSAYIEKFNGGYIIVAIPAATVEEQKQIKLNELKEALCSTDWMAIREHDRKSLDIDYQIDSEVF